MARTGSGLDPDQAEYLVVIRFGRQNGADVSTVSAARRNHRSREKSLRSMPRADILDPPSGCDESTQVKSTRRIARQRVAAGYFSAERRARRI